MEQPPESRWLAWGQRLLGSLAVFALLVLYVVVLLVGVRGSSGGTLFLAAIYFIGIGQLVYVLPLWFSLRRYRYVAQGVVIAAVVTAVVDVLALALSYWILVL